MDKNCKKWIKMDKNCKKMNKKWIKIVKNGATALSR
jgi:hypothetical protein